MCRHASIWTISEYPSLAMMSYGGLVRKNGIKHSLGAQVCAPVNALIQTLVVTVLCYRYFRAMEFKNGNGQPSVS